MVSNRTNEREAEDARQVDMAIEALASGSLRKAEEILLRVIANTPGDYANSEDHGDIMSIKFWAHGAFAHFVTWHLSQGIKLKKIEWIGNAYPRAHYYMGFMCVKRRQYDRAIEFLDNGLRLEPANPSFILEKAQALAQSGRNQEALGLFGSVKKIGPYVSGHEIAVALRGQGFVLIELGNLDGAETAFRESLKIEPGSEVALNEMRYIEHLRQGGKSSSKQAVAVSTNDVFRCAVCGDQADQGVMVSIDGMPISICSGCHRKLTKKWWQFWK